jgi:hypothetical protein
MNGVLVTSGARLRERDVIDAQITALSAVDPMGEFERGASAALRWLLEGGPGPVTGKVGERPTAASAIVHELAAAEAIIYGPRSERSDHARGAEHALMWAQFVTCSTPAPANAGTMPAQGTPRSGGRDKQQTAVVTSPKTTTY